MLNNIVIVDYGMGNLRSVGKALELAGADVCVTNSARQINSAGALVLPGVGSFGPAIKNLKKEKLVETIINSVNSGKQYLGLCLGFQFLFDSSEEESSSKGLGLIEGKVKKFVFKGSNRKLKIPHMGWNNIGIKQDHPLFEGISENSFVYFVHSYYVDTMSENTLAATKVRLSDPSLRSTSEPKHRTTSLSPSEPGDTTSRASSSASTTGSPRCRQRAATVLLPVAIPPVRPNTCISRPVTN